jgi:hypothetical protein
VIDLQDEWRAHSSTLMSYFMAEGVACHHQMLHYTLNPSRSSLQQTLPALVLKGSKSVEAQQHASTAGAETELKIAWQYRRCSLPTISKDPFPCTTAKQMPIVPPAPLMCFQDSAPCSARGHGTALHAAAAQCLSTRPHDVL